MAQKINKNWEYTLKSQMEFICKCIDNSVDYALGKKEPLERMLEQLGPDDYFKREAEKFSDRAAALAAYKAFIIKATEEEFGIKMEAAKPASTTYEVTVTHKSKEEKAAQASKLASSFANNTEDDGVTPF